MTKVVFQVESMSCPICAEQLEAAVKSVRGVAEARVLFTLSRLKVVYDETVTNPAAIHGAIVGAGYRAKVGRAS